MARRQHLTVVLILTVFLLLGISYLFTGPENHRLPHINTAAPLYDSNKEHEGSSDAGEGFSLGLGALPTAILQGESIAPKLENATLKAELGRATWKFLHTMVARFPEKPTPEDRQMLETFMHLLGRLYPCGDCARHFRQLLSKYPPQTSSRNAAAGWLCYAHNKVNERLEKPIFDCNTIGDFYDCGCGDEKKEGDGEDGAKNTQELH